MSQDDGFSSQDEFEAEWAEARDRAGVPDPRAPKPSHDLFVFPLLILYTGFFFGPWGTALMALHVRAWRASARDAGVFLGLAGLFWLAITGATQLFGGQWTTFGLQVARTSLNFVFAAGLYAHTRKALRETHYPSPSTIRRTLATAAVLVGAFFVIGAPTLIALGR